MINEKIEINGRDLIIESGVLARQADGAVKVTYGDTVILATCCLAEPIGKGDFFPLTVDYRERTYAAGKIPGGFFKREGRPQEKEVITSRLIDRPIRPLFPDGYIDEVQIMVTVLSSDGENDADIPSMIGASCALALSPAPFDGPIGVVRIGKIGDDFIINPTFKQLEESEVDLIISGTSESLNMLEGEARQTQEETILKAIDISKTYIREIIELQNKIIEQAPPKKIKFVAPQIDESLESEVRKETESKILDVYRASYDKGRRHKALRKIKEEVLLKFSGDDDEEKTAGLKIILNRLEKELLRRLVKEESLRVDGRRPEDLRNITCSAGLLPRTHGSGLFSKGETQALAVVTLGTSGDQQIMDALVGEYKKRFMLHYNFPPYSVGEVRPNRGPDRREIGHGLLAEKALAPVLEEKEKFPYTIRLVSDILESNGSSSMATICAGSIALMDAGVPVKEIVAGVGMGIIDGVILTDMLGDEDHCGDMDFKVAGTRKGITAIQMDIKISGITPDILKSALEQAKKARIKTINEIEKEISKPRQNLSEYAPQLATLKINPEKISVLIGPGGKNIKKIQEETNSAIDIEDDGTVTISADTLDTIKQAQEMVKSYTDEVEVGKIYTGKVVKIMDFGAFVQILPGKDGLVHISELAPYHVNKVDDILHEGDEVKVKCIAIDDRGRINLSRVDALSSEEREKERVKGRR